MADRSRLELEERNVQLESKREQDNLNRKAKDYSNSLKRCKRAEVQLQTAQAQVPFMRRQLEEASRQVQALMEDGRKQRAAVDELKREVHGLSTANPMMLRASAHLLPLANQLTLSCFQVDIFINSFLKQESTEKEKQKNLRLLLDSIKALEEEVHPLPLPSRICEHEV